MDSIDWSNCDITEKFTDDDDSNKNITAEILFRPVRNNFSIHVLTVDGRQLSKEMAFEAESGDHIEVLVDLENNELTMPVYEPPIIPDELTNDNTLSQ